MHAVRLPLDTDLDFAGLCIWTYRLRPHVRGSWPQDSPHGRLRAFRHLPDSSRTRSKHCNHMCRSLPRWFLCFRTPRGRGRSTRRSMATDSSSIRHLRLRNRRFRRTSRGTHRRRLHHGIKPGVAMDFLDHTDNGGVVWPCGLLRHS